MEENVEVKHRGRGKPKNESSTVLPKKVEDVITEMQNEEVEKFIDESKYDTIIQLLRTIIENQRSVEKQLCGFTTATLSAMIETVNDMHIQKDDIVTLLKHEGVDKYYTLLYYA